VNYRFAPSGVLPPWYQRPADTDPALLDKYGVSLFRDRFFFTPDTADPVAPASAGVNSPSATTSASLFASRFASKS
jgi:hypothetical protein